MDQARAFSSDWEAAMFLRTLAADSLTMNHLRHVAHAFGPGDAWRSKDPEILRTVSWLLAGKRLTVVDRYVQPAFAVGAQQEVRMPLPQRAAAAPAPSSPSPAEPDPDTFPLDLLHDVQAAALVSASQSGVPFCEECARAAQEGAA
jgi:hypothetical protein